MTRKNNTYFKHALWKDSDAGRDWGQEEKGMSEHEMAGWHHWLDGRESEWTPGVGDGQGGLARCNSWGRKELDTTERLNWNELIEIVTLASNAQMLSLNSDTCQVSDTLTSVKSPEGVCTSTITGGLFLLQSLPQSRSFHLDESSLPTLHFRDCAFSFNLRMICFAIRLEDFSFFARRFVVLCFTPRSMRLKLIFVQGVGFRSRLSLLVYGCPIAPMWFMGKIIPSPPLN